MDLFDFLAPPVPAAAAMTAAAVVAAAARPAALPPLDEKTLRRLKRLQNRLTAYEVEIVHPDGRRVLLCYTENKSKHGIMQAIGKRGRAVIAFLDMDDGATMHVDRGSQEIRVDGGGIVRLTGRTERDAIFSRNELPYVGTLTRSECDAPHPV